MADPVIVQNDGNSGSNTTGLILGIIALIVFGFLFVYYLLPALRQSSAPPTIQVPDTVQVDVQQ